MSTPCTTCGEPIDPTDGRCPTCAAAARPDPTDEAVVAVAAVDPTRTSEAPPWSIPIREPAAVAVAPTTDRRPRLLGLALLAVAVLAVAALVGTLLLDRDSGTTTGDTAQADPVDTDERAGLDVEAIRPTSTTATTAPSTTAPATTTTAAPTTTAAAPAAPATTTTTASAARTGPNGTGSVPALSTSFRGWLAQLTSVPYSAGTAALADEWERLRAAVPDPVAARSDDWSAFRDGFWVLVDPGPFRSADEVRSFCAAAGFDGDGTCLPRELRG